MVKEVRGIPVYAGLEVCSDNTLHIGISPAQAGTQKRGAPTFLFNHDAACEAGVLRQIRYFPAPPFGAASRERVQTRSNTALKGTQRATCARGLPESERSPPAAAGRFNLRKAPSWRGRPCRCRCQVMGLPAGHSLSFRNDL